MFNIDKNYLLILLGIALIVIEILLGVATGFDFLLIGIICIFSGAVGIAFNSISIALISILVLSVLYIFIGRKFIKQSLSVETKATNTESLLGKIGIVTKKISPHQPGQIKIDGEIWRAESEETIGQNAEVLINSVSGVTLKVTKSRD